MDVAQYIIRNIREAPKLASLYTVRNGKSLPRRRFYFSLEKRCRRFINGDVSSKTVIVPGLRGTGKTTALLQLYKYLTEKIKIPKERVLYINLEEVVDLLGSNLYEVADIYFREVLEETPESLADKVFLLIDEAHFDKKWQTAVKVLHDRSINLFIVVTGSSSIALEMSPDLVRRVVRENVYPLNFSEYLLLKHGYYKPKGACNVLRNAIFNGSFENVQRLYRDIELSFPLDLSVEFRKYLRTGGFAFGLTIKNEKEIYRKVFEIVEKIVRVDLPTVVGLRAETIPEVFRIIIFLALQQPGGVSIRELSSKIGIEKSTISKILDALEKTHLIFKVLPVDGAGTKIKKPWKYYFATPTINASINDFIGKYESGEFLGTMLETLVASYLKRVIDVMNLPYGLFYDANKRGVDFILEHTLTGERIPIEVSSSIKKEDFSKMESAITRYKSKFGIIVTLKDNLKIKDNIAVIPATLFGFL